ncbi:MAG: sugar phosphate isomerase/epimerase [Roseburia sp.]|nr:sugar phosphate isomerase/epimerase [Roseburia sp.]MCM1098733.1 sugar phosphate isomerase/epimerase [Ruminococcus flavefaciens]
MPVRAVQQIMLGTVTAKEGQAAETLSAVKKAGYDGIELNGFMIRPTSFMVRMMTKMAGMPVGKGGNLDWGGLVKAAGLSVVSVHEDLGTIQREPDKVIQEAKEFGTKYVVITGMYRFDYSDREAVQKLAEDLNIAGKALKDGGLALLYHNHNCEFRKVEKEKTAYQLLLEETDPEYLNFEFDSYWPTEAGVCALSLMKHLGGRMKLYHINDRGTRLQGASMTPILKSDSMELGYGNMDLPALAEQAKAAGVDAVILESHKNWAEKSPLKSIELSAEFMRRYVG